MPMQQKISETQKRPKSVAHVVEVLRERIASNELIQGAKLREIELADGFDVSRQTIRDAFTVLELKGLVTRIQNRGAFVARYDFQNVMDIFDIRESLSTLTYQLAARRAPEGAWAELVELFGSDMEAVIAEQDLKTYSDAILYLDQKASGFANNRFLEPMLEPITDLTQVLSRRMMLLPNRLEIGLDLNRRILDALICRDEDQVRRVFSEMMDVSREYLTKYREVLF